MRTLARFVLNHRGLIVLAWLVAACLGGLLAAPATARLTVDFSVPGTSAFRANQQTYRTFGTGLKPPLTVVLSTRGNDVRRVDGLPATVGALAAAVPGSRVSSYFSSRDDAYVSKDATTTFVNIYEPGRQTFAQDPAIPAIESVLATTTPAGVRAFLSGSGPMYTDANSGAGGPGVLAEAAIGGLLAALVLIVVFGTLPGVAMPLVVALASILSTFGAIWALTYLIDVSIVVEYLVALVGLGIAIDYALMVVFRFREELAAGRSADDAIIETIVHAGRAVIISGSTVAVGLLSMIAVPVPFLRSIGIGGMLIPVVSVLAAVTLLPACLSYLGPRIDRLRLLPRRFVQTGPGRFWVWWARLVTRRPLPLAAAGLGIVALLLIPAAGLHPGDAEARYLPGKGNAIQGRDLLEAKGVTAGVFKPLEVLIEGRDAAGSAARLADSVAATPGIAAAAAPSGWAHGHSALVEAFLADDPASPAAAKTIKRLDHVILPGLADDDTHLALGGQAASDHAFIDAVYGGFPLALAFVLLATYILLARAFRSLVLPLKATILNLASLGAAYGVVVFVFQQGHGSNIFFGVHATHSILPYIPILIFAFLYGVSMDYEVFMLARIGEEYEATGDTDHAVRIGLTATGRLVTSAALILTFAFVVLSTSPGLDVKQFGIGLAAGVIFDATVIRVLLVPTMISLFGPWNWWLPTPAARLLRVSRR